LLKTLIQQHAFIFDKIHEKLIEFGSGKTSKTEQKYEKLNENILRYNDYIGLDFWIRYQSIINGLNSFILYFFKLAKDRQAVLN
jgi:hypothetical protein